MFRLDAQLTALSSPDLLAALERTAAHGREVTADLIALLSECDARRLYAVEGFASLFEFCVGRLRLSEAQAYHRIQAARAARRFPLVLDRLRDGRVSLTAVALLRDHLTDANHQELLDWAEGRRKRAVEAFIRGLDPRPDVKASIRRLPPPPRPSLPATAAEDGVQGKILAVVPPARSEGALTNTVTLPLRPAPPAMVPGAPISALQGTPDRPDACPAPVGTGFPPVLCASIADRGGSPPVRPPVPRSEIRPLAPERYSLHVTISQETHDKLRRAQDLLRLLPTGDPALVLDRALTVLIAQLERRKAGAPATERRAARTAAPRKTATSARASGSTARPEHAPVRPHAADATTHAAAVCAVAQNATPPRRDVPTSAPSTGRPRRSRYIPAAVRRAVWDRDGARCAYVSPSGTRCTATAGLEFHHRIPFAEGGASTVENVGVTCAVHNALEARRWFNSDQAEFGL